MGRFTQSQTNQLATLAFFITTTLGAIASFAPYSDGKPSEFRLFSFHPLCLFTSLGLFVVGKLYKTLGGYQNTKLHGNLSFLGSLCLSVGVAAIYQNKENNDKPHFTSQHSQYALYLLAVIFFLLLNGLFGLHPDWGKVKTNKNIRKMHHWGGKFLLVGMCYMCYDGSVKIIKDNQMRMAFAAPLVFLAVLVFA